MFLLIIVKKHSFDYFVFKLIELVFFTSQLSSEDLGLTCFILYTYIHTFTCRHTEVSTFPPLSPWANLIGTAAAADYSETRTGSGAGIRRRC